MQSFYLKLFSLIFSLIYASTVYYISFEFYENALKNQKKYWIGWIVKITYLWLLFIFTHYSYQQTLYERLHPLSLYAEAQR
jgi:hypothetical protein